MGPSKLVCGCIAFPRDIRERAWCSDAYPAVDVITLRASICPGHHIPVSPVGIIFLAVTLVPLRWLPVEFVLHKCLISEKMTGIQEHLASRVRLNATTKLH